MHRWVEAEDLQIGQPLYRGDLGTIAIAKITRETRVETVYNLTVAKSHTYYVGVDKVLVHNAGPCPIGSPTVGELRKARLTDAHHIIQDATVNHLPGYRTNAAPGFQLHGRRRGTPHDLANQVQRQRGGGNYASERRIGYKALRRAGVSRQSARSAIARADAYFSSIGVNGQTATYIPKPRR